MGCNGSQDYPKRLVKQEHLDGGRLVCGRLREIHKQLSRLDGKGFGQLDDIL